MQWTRVRKALQHRVGRLKAKRRGRKWASGKTEWVKMNNVKQHRLMTWRELGDNSVCETVCVCERDCAYVWVCVCDVLTPLNGKNLDNAQRPLPAKLWWIPAGGKFLMRREDSGAALTLRERSGGREGTKQWNKISSLCSLHMLIVFPSLLQLLNTKTNILFSNGNTIMNEKSTLLLK